MLQAAFPNLNRVLEQNLFQQACFAKQGLMETQASGDGNTFRTDMADDLQNTMVLRGVFATELL